MTKKAYIVDDDEVELFLAQRLLVLKNFAQEVVLFRNGEAFLKAFTKDENPPEFVLLNYLMRGKNGLKLLEELREQDVDISKTSFIITSSTLDLGDLQQIDKSQLAKGFMSKPLLSHTLQGILDD